VNLFRTERQGFSGTYRGFPAVFDLPDSVALVTGASRGIGRAVALELGRAGADLVVHYRAEATRADALVDELRSMGRDALALGADVSDRAQVAEMVRRAGEWKGRLDGVVTSAGIFRGDLLASVGRSEWEDVIRTDLEGTFRTVQAAVPYLVRSDRPAVVTFSSVLGAHPAVGGAPYQAAKAGIEQLTRALAIELAPRIRVNAVAPGFIRTDMNRGGHEDPEFHRIVARATPLGRWGEVEDIAPAVRYLLSPEADWVTGAVLGIDGGIALR
jgi:3-oxoacyl-[acyl-carrier protein] reductase